MIRVVNKNTGELCSETRTVQDANAIVATAPDELEIDQSSLLDVLKAEATALVVEQAENYGNRLTAGYPLHEVLSWPVKIIEAKAICAGETDPSMTPVIASECQFTKAKPHDVALAVLAKARPFAMASGAISGLRQETIRRIGEATDEAGVNAALAWAKSAAEAAFATVA